MTFQTVTKFDYVIATKFYNPDPSPFREILDYQKLSPGDSETQFAFTPRNDAHIIERPLYTCVNELFKGHIKQLNIREIYVCGIATEACVLKTVLDLFESNIRSWLITDLCASDQEDKYHEIALKLIGKLINTIHLIDSKQVLQELNAK
jgi:nicotinamidase-related amidase